MTQITTSTPNSSETILFNLLVILLSPMFLPATGGDIKLAQMAAIETINEYRVHNAAGLIIVAQIIAFGLATIGSLSLSLQDDISIPMALRLRGNANALTRSAELNRQALANLPAEPPPPMTEEDHRREAAIIASVQAAQQAVADAVSKPGPEPAPQPEATPELASTPNPEPAPTPAAVEPAPAQSACAQTEPVPPAAAKPSATKPPQAKQAARRTPEQERQDRALWAAAIADVAGEFTASLPFLPPKERKLASLKASIASSSVTALLSGDPLPRSIRGALGPLIRPG